MRIWSLYPSHLDRIGLIAGWREALLAQAVLAERTRGYRHHPQLERFRAAADPVATIGTYLEGMAVEAQRRGYRFDAGRILIRHSEAPELTVTSGQVEFEWKHLGDKLAQRSPDCSALWAKSDPAVHPLFRVVVGGLESWERGITSQTSY